MGKRIKHAHQQGAFRSIQMNNFEDIISTIANDLAATETRKRVRGPSANSKLETSLRHLLSQLWKGSQVHEDFEGLINKRSNWYSGSPNFGLPKLSYRTTMSVYQGLKKLNLIRETRAGYFDRVTGEGNVTKFVATEKLLAILNRLEDDPFLVLRPNLNSECIVLRDNVNGTRTEVPFEDSPAVQRIRENLRRINQCLSGHWADLRIKDEDFKALQLRLFADKDSDPIDFSNWMLARIFSNGRFDHGGRFYRGWWQNVPSEYRKHITLDGKKTCEYDYSQLNPHMAYFSHGKELGSEDAYGRVFDGNHRDLVKEAFNAMMQASTELRKKPDKLDLSSVDMDWSTLRGAILKAHKPIEDMFFKGFGNHLQYIDSCIAEQVMLQFVEWNHPILPVHDSFIMHYAFGDMGELEEAMRRAFFNHFKKDIKVKGEIGVMLPSSMDGAGRMPMDLDDIIRGEPEYSLWQTRDRNCHRFVWT